jgi:anti-anti-sigma factor
MSNEANPLHVEHRGDVTIARFVDSGKIDGVKMQAAIAQVIPIMEAQQSLTLCLDLHNIEYLDSRALGILISVNKKLLGLGGRLSVMNVIPQICEIFAVTKLDGMIHREDAASDPG